MKNQKTLNAWLTLTALWTAGIWHRLLLCLLTSWYLLACKFTVLTILIFVCSTFTVRANAFIWPCQLFNLQPCVPRFPVVFATWKSILLLWNNTDIEDITWPRGVTNLPSRADGTFHSFAELDHSWEIQREIVSPRINITYVLFCYIYHNLV